MPATITIELKNLRFFAHHGWHEEEAIVGNEFDVTVLATFQAAAQINSITDTVDYAKMYAIIKTIFSVREKLLETIAQKIEVALQNEFPQLEGLQISITKLAPPIFSFTGTAGITYSKTFK